MSNSIKTTVKGQIVVRGSAGVNIGGVNMSNDSCQDRLPVLLERLASEGISTEDLNELQRAIKQDVGSPFHCEGKPGPNVKLWIDGMLGKALASSWNISLGAAGSLLASAIGAYYGWF